MNYNLLGAIIEKVSSISYREYMEQEILIPLGLNHTYVGFPEDEENYQEECWSVNEDLIREFLIPGFKMKNRNSKITDKVLHFMFSVDCREFRNSDAVKMGPMTLTEKIKEE